MKLTKLNEILNKHKDLKDIPANVALKIILKRGIR